MELGFRVWVYGVYGIHFTVPSWLGTTLHPVRIGVFLLRLLK